MAGIFVIIAAIAEGGGGGIGLVRTRILVMTTIGLIAIYKKNKTKRCGDFDNEISLGVYICYSCIVNEKRRNTYINQYEKSIEARTN
jgi:hypothetical protein